MLFSLIGAVLPHLFSLFGRRADDASAVEAQGLKTLNGILRYRALRILVIVIVSVTFSLWTVEQIHDIVIQWHERAPDLLRLFSGAGISALLRRVL